MSKKTLRIITIVATILAILCMCTLSFAANKPGDLKPEQKGTTQIDTVGKRVMGIIQAVGMIVSVAVIMVLGIKYMMGSAEEKAEYKKTMIPYVIGAILLFAATTIANAVYNFANGLNGTTTETANILYNVTNVIKG